MGSNERIHLPFLQTCDCFINKTFRTERCTHTPGKRYIIENPEGIPNEQIEHHDMPDQ